jgi:hypothetical protein
MAGRGRELKVYLTSDVSRFTRGLKGAEGRLGRFKRVAAGAFAGVAAGVAAGTAVMVDAVQAAAEDEQSQLKLAQAMEKVTGATDDQVAAMEAYVSAAQAKYGIGDDEIRRGLARLIRSTKDAARAQAIMNTAMDISAATGKPAAQVAEALAKFNDGNANALRRLGITAGPAAKQYAELGKAQKDVAKAEEKAAIIRSQYGPKSKEYAKAQERVADAMDRLKQVKSSDVKWLAELNDEFGGAAAEKAGTLAGKASRVAEAFGEINEALGEGAIEGFLESMGGSDGEDAIRNLQQMDADARLVGEALGGVFGSVVSGSADFIVGLKGLSVGWQNFVDEITLGVIDLLDAIALLGDEEAASQRQYLIGRRTARNTQLGWDVTGGRGLNGTGGGNFPGTANSSNPRSPNNVENSTRNRTRSNDSTGRADARAAVKENRTRSTT